MPSLWLETLGSYRFEKNRWTWYFPTACSSISAMTTLSALSKKLAGCCELTVEALFRCLRYSVCVAFIIKLVDGCARLATSKSDIGAFLPCGGLSLNM